MVNTKDRGSLCNANFGFWAKVAESKFAVVKLLMEFLVSNSLFLVKNFLIAVKITFCEVSKSQGPSVSGLH